MGKTNFLMVYVYSVWMQEFNQLDVTAEHNQSDGYSDIYQCQ